jgi:hypothetical protein
MLAMLTGAWFVEHRYRQMLRRQKKPNLLASLVSLVRPVARSVRRERASVINAHHHYRYRLPYNLASNGDSVISVVHQDREIDPSVLHAATVSITENLSDLIINSLVKFDR